MFGIGCGIALKSLEMAEAMRGDLAAWLLTGCGLLYMVWGIVHGMRNRDHHHAEVKGKNLTPWALFIIFVFGPCEPLIPMLMFPAATVGWGAALCVAAVFAVATLMTMCAMVLGISYGVKAMHFKGHRYVHAMAGAVILLCGVAIQMGL